MITLFHIGPKGFNIGNHAIGVGLQQHIHEAFGRVVNVISLPATSRYESHRRGGLTAETVHQINQFGHGVIVGGGNLYENGELEVDGNALAALEVPLMLFSLSWGRIYNRRGQLARRTDTMPDGTIRALNERASLSLARDRATLAHLHALGATGATLGGCPTIFLDRAADRLPDLTETDRGLALVSIRNPSLMNVPLPVQTRVPKDIEAIVPWLRAEGYDDVRLLCHDHRDIPFAASFHGLEYVYTDEVLTYLALLRACSINVSYRLHSALPCAAFGRPFIKLSYDERSLSLMETIGFGEWNVDIVQDGDVLETLRRRHESLDRLDQIRTEAEPTWNELGDTMTTAFKGFAAEVEEYTASVHRNVPRGSQR